MNDMDRQRRYQRMRDHGCIACFKIGIPNQPPDVHHLNLDNKAGQKRLGDDINMPLCPWHHRGIKFERHTFKGMKNIFGPSRALHKREFVKKFGTDEKLRTEYEYKAGQMDELAKGHLPEAERVNP